ncbi:hypothetical protein FOMA001_g12478 [Fusarium oxysporum f. sp. matthiolae]|nr:hypothetical protein FOMA001_g12478 [Fusarium oxysporum f. sp. matthiolae]
MYLTGACHWQAFFSLNPQPYVHNQTLPLIHDIFTISP